MSNVLDLAVTNEEEMIDSINTLPAFVFNLDKDVTVLKAMFLSRLIMYTKLIVLKCIN